MAESYRYIYEKGNKKYRCPNCKRRSLVRFVDTITNSYLPEQYGRCDHDNSCAYYLNPYLDGYAKMIWEQENDQKDQQREQGQIPVKPKFMHSPDPIYVPHEVFNQTLRGYDKNIFLHNLLTCVAFPFPASEVDKVIVHYLLGTICNGYRAGAITFPFIDKNGNVRAIQVKQFDKKNHTTSTDFLHSIIKKHHTKRNNPLPEWLEPYLNQEKFITCLFGEHLLSRYPHFPVALVEAPKTAVYGTLYFGFPQLPNDLIWLAVYNKSSFSYEKLKVLEGRDVYIFPDLSLEGKTFKEWQTKANDLERKIPGVRFKFFELLEQLASDELREKGADIADVLMKLDWRMFRKHSILEQQSDGSKPEHDLDVTVNCEICENCEPSEQLLFSHNKDPTDPSTEKTDSAFNQSSPDSEAIDNEGCQTLGDIFNLMYEYFIRQNKPIPKNITINGWD